MEASLGLNFKHSSGLWDNIPSYEWSDMYLYYFSLLWKGSLLLALFPKRENNTSLQLRDFWKLVKIIYAPYRLRGEKFVQKSSLNCFVRQLLERHVLALNTSERPRPGAKADTKKFLKNILSAAQANPLSWLREVLAVQLNSGVLKSTKYQKNISPTSDFISFSFCLYVLLLSFCFHSFLWYFCLPK